LFLHCLFNYAALADLGKRRRESELRKESLLIQKVLP